MKDHESDESWILQRRDVELTFHRVLFAEMCDAQLPFAIGTKIPCFGPGLIISMLSCNVSISFNIHIHIISPDLLKTIHNLR